MKSLLAKMMLLMLLVLPTSIMLFETGKGSLVVAGDDDTGGDPVEGEGEDDEASVEDEDTDDKDPAAVTETEKTEEEDEGDEEEESRLQPSPDVDTVILFTKPQGTTDLPAGDTVRFLVGFTNKGNSKFTVETLEASFRYPQDYSFFIQNFTAAQYNKEVEGQRQASFEYGFSPNEAFAGRPFGLSILLNYKDEEGKQFQSAVFNETVNIVEPDEGLDGETFFLYVFLAALVVLLLVGAQQLLGSLSRKHLSKPRPPVERGTQNTDVDYDWIPEETIKMENLNRSPGRSPKKSPRQRKNKRTAGSGEE
ncbi:hypothetical protein FSP39_003825 [Pinctada imbricata]|uniref:Translocon-associated protein subunit alpha n=1 Tax=Pinctada imbricata TaxID=66713 RepID=A0AA89BNE8_PINIB|nr:hypothetical protein FSP39_003825 [Pinctada imbricata]